MNAEDIRNVTFDKVMRGYRPEEVDAYLDQVAAELERLQTEKADAEKKMYILAEKVDQYRQRRQRKARYDDEEHAPPLGVCQHAEGCAVVQHIAQLHDAGNERHRPYRRKINRGKMLCELIQPCQCNDNDYRYQQWYVPFFDWHFEKPDSLRFCRRIHRKWSANAEKCKNAVNHNIAALKTNAAMPHMFS